MFLIYLFVLILCVMPASGFSTKKFAFDRSPGNTKVKTATSRSFPVALASTSMYMSSATTWASSEASSEAEAEAEELLNLLLKKFKSQTTRDEISRIEELMASLASKRVQFDPKRCLNGPLFAALHQSGPQPFWEKYDLSFGSNKNIKGQRYIYKSGTEAGEEDGDGDGDGSYEVFNYAQFAGEQFFVTGDGSCTQNQQTSSDNGSDEDSNGNGNGNPKKSSGNIFDLFFGKGGKLSSSSSSSLLVQCPADYTIQVTGASFNILNNRFNIGIQGTGYMRVLYADENLRLFTSPKDNTNELVGEEAGLTVAQVRLDLVDPSLKL